MRLNNELDYTENAAGDEAKLYIRTSNLMWLILAQKWRYVEQAKKIKLSGDCEVSRTPKR